MFKKVLVANRGEIACRIIKTLDKLGIASVAVYSEADRHAPHVGMATESFCIGPPPVAESYLQVATIVETARSCGADAVHPGYGLLSENSGFAQACEKEGIAFIGPTPEQLVSFGLKHEARELVLKSEGPLLPGTGLLSDAAEAAKEAQAIGYPVMLKSTAGGGGIGMQICTGEAELEAAFLQVERLGQSHFGQGGVFIEKYIERARHLEVQVFGNGEGRVVSLGVRDCSAQRRNQKVFEETPPPNVTPAVMQGIQEAALRLAGSVSYRSAGTVEFIYDASTAAYYFLEVNTRLQVEHGVTELVTGIDLVEWMVRQAAGEDVLEGLPEVLPQTGHSIQARVYAEDPYKDFQPSSGVLTDVQWAEGIRLDNWVSAGTEVTPYYDPLLAKVLVHADNREAAVASLQSALEASRISGIETNLGYLSSVAAAPSFMEGKLLTSSLADHAYAPRTFEILNGGTMTTVQDYPGRTGYWDVGVPPSGPLDSLAFRLANRLLGNEEDAAGLEITALGPRIRFNTPTTVVLTGARTEARLNGQPFPFYEPVVINPGDILEAGKVLGPGVRAYLGIRGGIDVPKYLGSRSTFTLGQFGGHAGRALRTGDVLHLFPHEESSAKRPTSLPLEHQPPLSHEWEIGVLYGPHGAPDFFTEDYIETFFQTEWEIHYNSARTGIRLVGEKPGWARTDGGEAGLHPSNIHDNAYAIGAVDFTGDMPVILGPDGPSLGGFVCPVTVVQAELWKLGQLRPGDKVRFRCLSPGEAKARALQLEAYIREPQAWDASPLAHHVPGPEEAILSDTGGGAGRLLIRRSGDTCVLAEIGDMLLDFELRFHIHVLYEQLKQEPIDGIIDLTPGIRSLQVHFDTAQTDAQVVAAWISARNAELPPLEDLTVPSRIIHLPLSWDDPSTREAIDKYMKSVRPDAPWCPDNIEFIRRINGLDSRESVKDIVYNATYVVLGLGDVYLGAPVATPLDPRHRLVTTKYNPARTWTPENAVGIGGAYMCVYGMEGPGGYQFVGRTIQMWNRYKSTASFETGKPWLLRFFDQIRFYPVSKEELVQLREDFPEGRFDPPIEDSTFSLKAYLASLDENASSIERFRQQQRTAFEEERERWEAAGISEYDDAEAPEEANDTAVSESSIPLDSPVSGSMWKLLVEKEGVRVKAGDAVAIVESMKMEVRIEAPCDGIVTDILVREGQAVTAGQVIYGIESA